MGISLRHHVLSLVAVFLMLLVGLLVGVGLSSDPELTRHIQGLNEQFKQLMEENQALSRDASAQEQFAREALPRLVGRKLDGKCAAVIVTSQPQDNDYSNDIMDLLAAAGTHVPYRVVLRKGFADRAVSALGPGKNRSEACEAAVQSIAESVAQADEAGLNALKKQGLIRIRGRPDEVKPSMAVIVGGARQGEEALADLVDEPLIEALMAQGIQTIVGCEDSAEVSYVETYRQLGISTVDNIDLARGRFSLVMALGGQPGNYGDGPSAEEEFATLE